MKSSRISQTILFAIMISLLLLSCSTQKEINNINYGNESYLNKQLSDEKYNNVSLGILIQDVGLDTVNVENIQSEFKPNYYFRKSFIEQFPKGMVYFSNFSKVEWIYYNPLLIEDYVIQTYKNELDQERNFTIPYSMEHLREGKRYDFLMYLQNFTFIQIDPEQNPLTQGKGQKYKTRLIAIYYLWDNRTLNFIATNQIDITSEFEHLPEKWPYKNAIMKLSAMIIDDLPMFKK